MAKRPRPSRTLVLDDPFIRNWEKQPGNWFEADVLVLHSSAIPQRPRAKLKTWCRPTVLHLHLPTWPVFTGLLLDMMDTCGVSVEELHVHTACYALTSIWHRLPNLRHIYFSPNTSP